MDAVSPLPPSPASVNTHSAVAPETPLYRPFPVPVYVSKSASGGFGVISGLSVQTALVRSSRWKRLPSQLISRLFGRPSQCSSKPCVTRPIFGPCTTTSTPSPSRNTLPPPVIQQLLRPA